MGDHNSYDAYRPVSLVSMFSKVFEACLSKRLMLEKCVDPL
jgi:hypothetical protein